MSITTVPFQLVDEGIRISVEIDGRQGYGIYDTDMRYLVVNSQILPPRARTKADSTTTKETRGHGPVHTFRVGGMTRTDDRVVFTPFPDGTGAPVLALLGLDALVPYETILDFRKRQLTLVRLDVGGHPHSPVPGLTPIDSVPLVWDSGDTDTPDRYVMVRTRIGAVPTDFYFNTAVPWSAINAATRKRLRTYLTPRAVGGDTTWMLDHLALGKSQADTVEIVNQNYNFFGLRALQQFGVVGINLRTMRLIVYR